MTDRSLPAQILRPRCPRCGQAKLFKTILRVVDECPSCGLVLKHHDAADAPAFFAICFVGLTIMLGAAIVEVKYSPPMWLHAALWLPLTIILCFASLRMFKTIMITVEYRLALLKGQKTDV